jgi:ribosomal protein S18 acetylase RimI-like enzyme
MNYVIRRMAPGEWRELRVIRRGPTGLGARLVDVAIRFAEQHIDGSRLMLGVHESNTRALAFYRRIGFCMTGKVIPYRPNPVESCFIMEYSDFKSGARAGRGT